MGLIALGGTTFGLAEETMAFYPMLIPVFLEAGYDTMTVVATIFLGTTLGTLGSTITPLLNGYCFKHGRGQLRPGPAFENHHAPGFPGGRHHHLC